MRIDNQSRDIALEFITALGLPPVEFVNLAAELGCRHIGIGLEPLPCYAGLHSPWSLRRDEALRAQMIATMRDRNVSSSLGEGFLILPKVDIRQSAADMDLMCELGVPRVNVLALDCDRNRSFDQCAVFAELAEARGLQATLEFVPGLPIGDLPSALAAVEHVGKDHFRVLIDTMHLFRCGSRVADVAAMDPNLIGYVQLCDVPWVSKHASYADEARLDRLAPGRGELPLLELLEALPADVMLGLEVPMFEQARAGVSAQVRLADCIAQTRELVARLEPQSRPASWT